jgi:hypothetical protein
MGISWRREAAMGVIAATYQRANLVVVKPVKFLGCSNCPEPRKRDTSSDPCNQPDRD